MFCFAVCATLTEVTHCVECTDKTQSTASKCTACASGFTVKEDNSECLCKYSFALILNVSIRVYKRVQCSPLVLFTLSVTQIKSTAAENVALQYSCVYDSCRFKFNEPLYDIAEADV